MRSALSSAAAMWFPSSNNVSVIYEWPTTIPAQPPQYSTISSPYHNKLRPSSHTHTEACMYGVVCVCSICIRAIVRERRYVKHFYACTKCLTYRTCANGDVFENSPFGGGLTSVSPCWFELSDCPDCSERRKGGRKKRDG